MENANRTILDKLIKHMSRLRTISEDRYEKPVLS